MIRLTGCIMIVICSTAIGFSFAGRIQSRVKELDWFSRLLDAVCEELTFSMAPVEEILRAVSLRKELCHPPLLERYLQIAGEAPFPECWKRAVGSIRWNIREEDRLMILSLSEVFGAYDCENQIAAIQGLKQRSDRRAGEEKQGREQHIKLCHTLGILSGVGLCILII